MPPEDNIASSTPAPAYIPPNSYWPFFLAIGIMFFVWTPALFYMEPWVMLGIGGTMMTLSIGGWVKEILHDWRVRDGG